MRALVKAVAYLAFAFALGLLWWVAIGRATNPALPPPRRVVRLRRPPGLPPPPQAKFDLEEFRWRNEDASFRWR